MEDICVVLFPDIRMYIVYDINCLFFCNKVRTKIPTTAGALLTGMQADGTRVFVKYSKDKLFAENRSNWRFSEKDFLEDDSPAYSGKQRVSGDRRIFSSKRSFLLRKRMMEVSPNHLLLHIESNSLSDSCIRFWNRRMSRCRQCPHAGIICSQIVL